MSDLILVTGATGTIGREVVKSLATKGANIRAAVRDKAKAAAQFNVEFTEFDFENEVTFARALNGVGKLFVLPPLTPNQTEIVNRLVDAAKKSGIKQIVKLSAIGIDSGPPFLFGKWHAATDQHIVQSGVAFTILRPNSFMQNFLNYFAPRDGVITLPWGAGQSSFVDTRDIASVAAEALTREGHAGKIYILTGPRALGIAEVGQILSKASGREIKYVDVPESDVRDGLSQAGAPQWQIDGLLELHAINKQSLWSGVTEDVPKVIGKPATSFEEFARDYATKFR